MPDTRIANAITRLTQTMKTLRSPKGCPWDADQTPESLKPYLIEEAYEVIDAIDNGNTAHICEELGDLLLQIVFHSQIFNERGAFDLADVADSISEKLVRRHPHVFETEHRMVHADHNEQWEWIKKEEKKAKGEEITLFGDIPRALPALKRTEKFIEKLDQTKRKSTQTIDEALAQTHQALSKLESALPYGAPESITKTLGQLLYAVVMTGKRLDLPSEEILHQTITSQMAALEIDNE